MTDRSPVKALFFDLDGTLIDSLPDLAEAVNDMMAANGLPAHTTEAVSRMVGKGVPVLVSKAFAGHGRVVEGDELKAEVVRYLGFYEPRATRLTKLFPHAEDMLRALASDYKLAVCTNKPEGVSREIIASFGLSDVISTVVGGDCGVPAKPAPDMMWLTAKRLGVSPEACVMVGDSVNDVVSAKAAGIRVAVVRYGYTETPADELGGDYVLDDFRDIPAMIEALS